MSTITDDLRQFYDAEAVKYTNTRKKVWSDASLILNEIKKSEKKTLSVLEFGCGGWRLLEQLWTLEWYKINYTGIDISKNLLNLAKKEAARKNLKAKISATFVCDDILHAVKQYKQESFDFVIGIASFQHITSLSERFFLMKSIYRILKYEWVLLMTNWSFSMWLCKKFWKEIVQSCLLACVPFKKRNRNDIMIPWKNGSTTFQRFYHIYTLAELKKLIAMSGFIIQEVNFINKKGVRIASRKDANNTFVVARKNVFE